MTTSTLHTMKARTWIKAALPVLMACLAAGAFWNLGGGRKDFYNNLWAPAYLLVRGGNAYDTSSLSPELPPLWLPPAVGVFAPLGWLPEQAAARVWLLLSLAALAVMVFLRLAPNSSIPTITLAGFMAFFFPPTVSHLVLGQFSILSALCCLLAAVCAARKRPWAEAFLLGLALAKPQLSFLAIAGLGFHHLRQESPAGAGRFGLHVGAAALAMSLPVILVSRGWLQSLASGFVRNPSWPHPSIVTFLRAWVPAWAWPLWGLALAAGLFTCWRLWSTLPPREAMSWTLALTPLFSPYIWSWDFVLLLPAWIQVFSRVGWQSRVFLLLAYLAGWAGMAAIQFSADFSNLRFWWVPLWYPGALAVIAWYDGVRNTGGGDERRP